MPKRTRPTTVTIKEVFESDEGDVYIWALLDGKELSFSIHKRGIISRKRHAGLGYTEVTVNSLGEVIFEEDVDEGDDLDGILIFIEQMMDHWEENDVDWHQFATGAVDDEGRTNTPTNLSLLPANHKARKKHKRRPEIEKQKPLRKKMPEWREKRKRVKDIQGRTLGEIGGRTWDQVANPDSNTSEQHQSLKRKLAGLQGEDSSETSL